MVNGISGNNPIKKPVGEPIKLPIPDDRNDGSIFNQDPGFDIKTPPINDPGFEIPVKDPGDLGGIKLPQDPSPIKDPGDLGGLPKETPGEGLKKVGPYYPDPNDKIEVGPYFPKKGDPGIVLE